MKNTNYIEMEVETKEHSYKFFVPVGAPLGEAYDAAIQFASVLAGHIKEYVEKSKPEVQEEKK